VGKRNLENAIVSAKAQFPQAEFEVNWRPFQLDPNASKEGINKLQHYNKKFGEERIKMMLPRMMETFAKVGLPYSMGGLTGNTFDSHRLIYFAAAKGGPALQDALVEELFKNYFCEEKYIGDRGVLLQAAITAGLDKAEAERVLDDPSAYAKVRLFRHARQDQNVPHVGTFLMCVAQDVSIMRSHMPRTTLCGLRATVRAH
jgi:predicted DsbA family dithiol-disulfide isomerase